MIKEKAMHQFWNSFGIPAYEEFSVPARGEFPLGQEEFPRLTYSLETDSYDRPVSSTVNVWYRSSSWEGATNKANEIAQRIKAQGHCMVPYDGGYAYVTAGTPFAQRVDDPDEYIRRILINVNIEYLSLI